MGWDTRSAGNWAKHHAEPGPTNNCASYVRKAIKAGGVTVTNTQNAKDYGPMLSLRGLEKYFQRNPPELATW